MSMRRLSGNLCKALMLTAGVVLAAGQVMAGSFGFQDSCCQQKCPPAYKHRQEGPPKIRMKCGCGKPVCDPCNLPHFGYYRPCWQPWPYPADWSYCPNGPGCLQGFAPPAVMLIPGRNPTAPDGKLPMPRKDDRPFSNR